MPLKTWLVAALGLGSLLLLIALSILASSRKAQDIYVQLDQLGTHHRLVETNLRGLRSDVNLSGVFVRDYLLDVARERGPGYREQLTEFREANIATLAELEKLIGRDERITSLRAKLDEVPGRPSIRCSTGRRRRRFSGAPGSCVARSCPGATRC